MSEPVDGRTKLGATGLNGDPSSEFAIFAKMKEGDVAMRVRAALRRRDNRR
jgi:hypothetical protein